MQRRFNRFRLSLVVLGVWVGCRATAAEFDAWRAFRNFSLATAEVGTNLLANAGLEIPSGASNVLHWSALYPEYGYRRAAEAHGGTQAIHFVRAPGIEQQQGAYQRIVLNQSRTRAFKLSGWSKALEVSGAPDSAYAIYVDLWYTNGTPLYGQTLNFAVGTHDWQYLERLIVTTQPVRELACYLLFRNDHTGQVWFDDLTVTEVADPVSSFDGATVLPGGDATPPAGAAAQTLTSGDGLTLRLTTTGGLFSALEVGGRDLHAVAAAPASGWLLCDRRATSDWWHVGGTVAPRADGLGQQGVVTALNLAATLRYQVTNAALRLTAVVSNLAAGDRALSIAFALPAEMTGGLWWETPRRALPIEAGREYAALVAQGFGCRNLSRYPLAAVARDEALALALPPDRWRPFRLVYDGGARLFYAVFDVGLSPLTARFPQQAEVEVWLYRVAPEWGLRDALAGLDRRFPEAAGRRYTNEGVWVAFAPLTNLTDLADFHIAYHESSANATVLRRDDSHGIPTFRYVSEPWSWWMPMPTNLPNDDAAVVTAYLLERAAAGVPQAQATLSSGIRGRDGQLRFLPAAAPWCPHGAAFYLNASPFIHDAAYPLSKFSNDWSVAARAVYAHPENGVLDGEYIDSFSGYGGEADFSTNHHRTTTFPLTYRAGEWALMTPLIVGTYEMCRAIDADLRPLNRPLIANGGFAWPCIPIARGLFDFTGAEVHWLDGAGQFIQPADAEMLYNRALSGRRAYGLLLNADFSNLSAATMEAYLRACAVYGFYPSAFSFNASGSNYWDQTALVERDRPLFRKYIPIIQAMNARGWQPVTHAVADASSVALERFGEVGAGRAAFLTLRNLATTAVSARVSLDLARWLPPGAAALALSELCDGGSATLPPGGGSFDISLEGGACRIYQVQSIWPIGTRLECR